MKLILICLCAFFGAGFGRVMKRSDNSDMDNLFDMALSTLVSTLQEQNEEIVHLPSLSQAMEGTWMGINLSFKFKADGGEFRNLSSIKRMAPATVFQDDSIGNMTFSTEIGLTEMAIHYKNFDGHFLGLESSGEMTAKCGTDALSFSLTLLTENDKCKPILNWARITKLGKFDIDIKPGFMNRVRSVIFSYILDLGSGKIISKINENLQNIITKYMGKILEFHELAIVKIVIFVVKQLLADGVDWDKHFDNELKRFRKSLIEYQPQPHISDSTYLIIFPIQPHMIVGNLLASETHNIFLGDF